MKPLAGRGGKAALASCRRRTIGAVNALKGASAAIACAAIPMLAAFAPLAAQAADLKAVNEAAALGASSASSASGAVAASAASGTAVLGAGSAVPALGFGAVLQTVFGLAVVIAVVFGCAWLARRLGLQGAPRNALVKTVGGASLGGKERVAVVEIGDTWLVLGAAPGNVRLLHTMPAGTAPQGAPAGPLADPAGPLAGSFGQRFRDALKNEAGKRFRRHDGGAQ
ncbi:flagellar biosynthetic protein FliO [Paraburkholderia ferrariae]|uniref:flagellar biosynthetic protein FliO n=1 Tax=Paraburkholderia ferrariae TaxID=386056 RepID=UPI000A03878F